MATNPVCFKPAIEMQMIQQNQLPNSKHIVEEAGQVIDKYMSFIRDKFKNKGNLLLFSRHGTHGIKRAHFYGCLILNKDSTALSLSSVIALLISKQNITLKEMMVTGLRECLQNSGSAIDLAILIKNKYLSTLNKDELSPLDITSSDDKLDEDKLYSNLLTVILSIAELRPAEYNGKSVSINTNDLCRLREHCISTWNNSSNIPSSTTEVQDAREALECVRMSVDDFKELKRDYLTSAGVQTPASFRT